MFEEGEVITFFDIGPWDMNRELHIGIITGKNCVGTGAQYHVEYTGGSVYIPEHYIWIEPDISEMVSI